MKDLGIVLTIALGLLLAAEACVRFLAPQHDHMTWSTGQSLGIADSVLGHRNRPNTVVSHNGPEYSVGYSVNGTGLRTRSTFRGRERANSYRILLIGDSFTFGIGSNDEDSWPAHLERALRDRGYGVEVLNAGVPGYDTRAEALYLEGDGDRWEPDLVVLAFLPNDLFTNAPLDAHTVEATTQVIVSRSEKRTGLHLVTMLQRLLLRNDAVYCQVYRRSERGQYFDPTPPKAVRAKYDTTRDLLLRFDNYCRERSIPLIVYSLPQQFQVLVAAGRCDPGPTDPSFPDRALGSTAREAGFGWISALDTLAQAYNDQPSALYYRYDGHLTPVGNRVVGVHLANRLDSLLGVSRVEN